MEKKIKHIFVLIAFITGINFQSYSSDESFQPPSEDIMLNENDFNGEVGSNFFSGELNFQNNLFGLTKDPGPGDPIIDPDNPDDTAPPLPLGLPISDGIVALLILSSTYMLISVVRKKKVKL